MDVTDDAMKVVFARLRPACVAVTQGPTRSNVATLTELLGGVTDGQLGLLQEYVLFPLRIYIKQSPNRDAELCRDVVDALRQVVCRSAITRAEVFQDIFNSLCVLISGPEAQVSDRPEELKLAVVQCLAALVGGVHPDLRRTVYSLPFLPALGHAVSLLLSLLTTECYHRLQAASGRCLLDLLVAHSQDSSVRAQVGVTFSSFLPGITMATTRVATRDVKQGHVVIGVSIEVWTATVAVVLGDQSLPLTDKPLDDGVQPSTGLPTEMEARLADLRVSRSAEWVKVTTDKLQVLVNKLTPLVSHPSWQVRLALVAWAESLLTKCSNSMPAASAGALDVLVQLAADDYASVSTASQAALQEVRARMEKQGSRHLLVVLEENLHGLATRLPRLIRDADDEKKLSTLVLFNGYLKLLGRRVAGLLLSASHLQRVSAALVQVLEFDTSHIELVHEAHTGFQISLGSGCVGCAASPRFYFKHFRDESVHQMVVSICHTLGTYGDLDLLVDHFLEVAHQGSTYRKQAFYIMNEIILGVNGNRTASQTLPEAQSDCVTENPDQLARIIESLLEEYLSPKNWYIDTEAILIPETRHNTSPDWRIVPANQRVPNKTLLERSSNILQICILLEGISNFAQALGMSFQRHLVDVIYPLMERLGDSMAAINTTAQRVANDIATACGYSNLNAMVCANSDYLVNAISLRLRHIERYPKSPCVLQSVLKHSTADALPLFEDIIQEVFAVLDDHYDTRAAVLMYVLYNLTAAIRHWHSPKHHHHQRQTCDESDNLCGPPPSKITKLSNNADKNEKSSGDNQVLVQFLRDYTKLKDDADIDMEATAEDSGIDPEKMSQMHEEDAEEETKVVPQHIQVVKQILERCCHLLSAPEPRLRLVVLRTVAEGCIVMEAEQNELLPTAHRLWAPFVKRFQDDEPLVALEAIKTLETMGETTGDFLRMRIVDEVLPAMADFLTKQAKVSVRAGAQYKYTVLSKLQVAAIQTVSSICRQVSLKGCLLYRVAQACVPYLSSRQPQHLQQVSLEAFETFIETDADATWLLLIELHCPSPLTPPDDRFPNHKVGSCMRSEYSEHIAGLLAIAAL